MPGIAHERSEEAIAASIAGTSLRLGPRRAVKACALSSCRRCVIHVHERCKETAAASATGFQFDVGPGGTTLCAFVKGYDHRRAQVQHTHHGLDVHGLAAQARGRQGVFHC